MPADKRVEFFHVSLLHCVYNLQVRGQILLQILLFEDLAVGNLTHEQLYDNQKFLGMDTETNSTNLRRLSQGLDEGGLRLGVLELDSLDAPLVVQVSCVLIVGD